MTASSVLHEDKSDQVEVSLFDEISELDAILAKFQKKIDSIDERYVS